MKPRRIAIFTVVSALAIITVPLFSRNVAWLLNPNSADTVIKGNWLFVFFYVLVFSLSSLFLYFPKKNAWKKYSGAFTAFIVALFTEMFGLPLTLYLLSPAASLPAPTPAVAFQFELLGGNYNMTVTSLIAGFLSIIGIALIVLGWKKIYRSKRLVTSGVYAYSRHPQYLGIITIVVAWFIDWPTILTLILGPLLVVIYCRLARREEKELTGRFGVAYARYRRAVPFLI